MEIDEFFIFAEKKLFKEEKISVRLGFNPAQHSSKTAGREGLKPLRTGFCPFHIMQSKCFCFPLPAPRFPPHIMVKSFQ